MSVCIREPLRASRCGSSMRRHAAHAHSIALYYVTARETDAAYRVLGLHGLAAVAG